MKTEPVIIVPDTYGLLTMGLRPPVESCFQAWGTQPKRVRVFYWEEDFGCDFVALGISELCEDDPRHGTHYAVVRASMSRFEAARGEAGEEQAHVYNAVLAALADFFEWARWEETTR